MIPCVGESVFELPHELMKGKEKELYSNFRSHRDQCDVLGSLHLTSYIISYILYSIFYHVSCFVVEKVDDLQDQLEKARYLLYHSYTHLTSHLTSHIHPLPLPPTRYPTCLFPFLSCRYERDMIWYEMSTKGGGGGEEEEGEGDEDAKKKKRKKRKDKKKKSEDPVMGAVQKRGGRGYGSLDPDYKV